MATWGLLGTAAGVDYGSIRSLPLEAEIDGGDLVLRWNGRTDVIDYEVERINPDGGAEPPFVLPGDADSLTVSELSPGQVYEWRVTARLNMGFDAHGVLRGGIDVGLVERRGRVLVGVSSEMLEPLAGELDRLFEDLAGDGWRPQLVAVPQAWGPPDLKAAIVAEHAVEPVGALFLIGGVPVPYSGSIAPDSHTTHRGAWPADVYYGDIDGEWTDTWRNDTGANWTRNHNVVGDGKFDQSSLPSDVELMVGRVDLADLPAFAPATEEDLLRGYLDRDHAFRHGELVVPRLAVVDDHLRNLYEGVAATARSGFAGAVGRGGVLNRDWPDTVGAPSYLLGAGFGYASWSSINGVATASTLAASDPSVVFSLLFGSYFGDWDNGDNMLRAAIAVDGATLASGFNGRPQWQLHGIGIGEPLGAIARRSQNAASGSPYFTSYYGRQIHVALHGDPTLRLFPRPPVGEVEVARAGSGASVSWAPAPAAQDLLGYHVYRGVALDESFERLTAGPVAATAYVDPSAPAGGAVYQVRAIYREVTGSGSFLNNSQGVFATLAELPKVELVESTALAREGGNPVVFELKRTGDGMVPLTAKLEFQGTADFATDFYGSPDAVLMGAGELSKLVAISAVDDGLAEGAEELLVSVAVPEDGSYSVGAAAVCVTVYEQDYGEWVEDWFGHDAPEREIGGESADPDSDGVANLVEYALGTSPVEGGAVPLEFRGMETIGGTDYRSFATRRAGLAAGVVLKLEVSEDLRAWSTPADMQVRDHAVETGVVETTFLVPDAPGREREFVRLVAEYLQ